MSIGISGHSSAIAREFVALVPGQEHLDQTRTLRELRQNLDRYLVCEGMLTGRRVDQQPAAQLDEVWQVNFAATAQAVERILTVNENARICIIGSDSGFTGSFDMAYAGSKAALHLFVEARRLKHPGQQLVAIAPAVIADAGMTTRRADRDRLEERARQHPKGRFVTAAEVAKLAHFLLFEDRGFLSGTVIRMNGGESACR